MTDYAELTQMASASLGEWYATGELRYEDRRSGDLHGLPHEDERFISAANPAAVLALIAENERLEAESENHRMQLVACGVVALANTRESAAVQREMHPDYASASCHDVIRAVDREMDIRDERDQLKAENERLRNESTDALAVNRTIRQQLDCYVKDAERLEKATAFVQQLRDAAGKQPSVATGYLHDILSVMSREAI